MRLKLRAGEQEQEPKTKACSSAHKSVDKYSKSTGAATAAEAVTVRNGESETAKKNLTQSKQFTRRESGGS